MFVYAESLLGLAAPDALVWWNSGLVTLAIAGALVLSVAGLLLVRDRTVAPGAAQRERAHLGDDRRLPAAA